MPDLETTKLPVFIEYDQMAEQNPAIGFAADRAEAARVMRRHLAETAGDGETGITAKLVEYSSRFNAFFLE